MDEWGYDMMQASHLESSAEQETTRVGVVNGFFASRGTVVAQDAAFALSGYLMDAVTENDVVLEGRLRGVNSVTDP